ncbi:hypothetical protein RDI58_015302 [Solanum bulbocastanum]|uniref:Uncharacterized protein n=1 Tax=Solanum bulbocastanum TaxID=147425 RepID=A0AAN8YBV4_SOLBU
MVMAIPNFVQVLVSLTLVLVHHFLEQHMLSKWEGRCSS